MQFKKNKSLIYYFILFWHNLNFCLMFTCFFFACSFIFKFNICVFREVHGLDRGRHVPPPSFMRVNAGSEGMQQKPTPLRDLRAQRNYKSAALIRHAASRGELWILLT